MRLLKIMVISLLLLMVTCKHHETSAVQETYQIISVIIYEYAKPIPPPPPPGLSETDFNRIADSIKLSITSNDWMLKEFILCIDSMMLPPPRNINNPFGKETQLLYDKWILLNNPQKIRIDKVAPIRNVQIQYNDGNITTDTEWNTKDMVLSFSRIGFNKDYSKAILNLGLGRGRLNGFSEIILLEKIEGLWKISKTYMLEIS